MTARHPEAFRDIHSIDLIQNDALAIKAAAFVLRDLQDDVNATAPESMKRKYFTQELAAAAYNIGLDNLKKESYPQGQLGKYGTSYSSAMMRNYKKVGVICQTGRWTC
jgi:hypothetical protein